MGRERDRDEGEAEGAEGGREPEGDGEPVRIPAGDSIDLHAFAPADVISVVEEFLGEAARAGFRAVRLIHGKGGGIQRARVRSFLASHPAVLSFRDAPGEGGGWGATVALLDPSRFSQPLELDEPPAPPPVPPPAPAPAPPPVKGRGRGAGKRKILFLCTGNACRSQMAEGFARALKGDVLEPYSAGVLPSFVHPVAAKVMAEAGVDISLQYSKHVDDLAGIDFDWVVTLCDYAAGACPVFPGHGTRFHRPFEDPIHARGTEGEIIDAFRAVRDRIRTFVETLPASLEQEEKKR
jgi:arsenate reductase